MAAFPPISIPESLKQPRSKSYFMAYYQYALRLLETGAEGCNLPFMKSQEFIRSTALTLRDSFQESEMLTSDGIFFVLRYLCEASRVCPDTKTRIRTYDELREYPDVDVCDPLLVEGFAVAGMQELDRDLRAGYEKLSPGLRESIAKGNSILFPVHHSGKIATLYVDETTGETHSCASPYLHWSLMFAHRRPSGGFDLYHYDSLPCQANMIYAFKVVHAVLDSVLRFSGCSPATVLSFHCSFSDRPNWPFPQIVPASGIRCIEKMVPQTSGTSCGLFVLGYGHLIATMRSPLKNSAVEQVTETYVKLLSKFFLEIFVSLLAAYP